MENNLKTVKVYIKGVEDPHEFKAKFVNFEKSFVLVQKDGAKEYFATNSVARIVEG